MEAQSGGPTDTEQDLRERAVRRLKRKREFLDHLGTFIFVNAVLWVIWAIDGASTDDLWPAWVTGIWGVFLVLHAWRVYGAREEISEREIEAEMSRLRRG
jgi:2TM domain